jgi:hypothetical protein
VLESVVLVGTEAGGGAVAVADAGGRGGWCRWRTLAPVGLLVGGSSVAAGVSLAVVLALALALVSVVAASPQWREAAATRGRARARRIGA